MKKRLLFFAVSVIIMAVVGFLLLQGKNIPVLNPQGVVAEKQRDLIVFTVLLSAVVVIPVYILLFVISWKYREGNRKPKKYTPGWDSNKWLETVWWGIPIAIILVLAVVAWRSSHELDPGRPLDSAVKPLTIQVVALQWKWLFIYPEQRIATVNYVQFPEKTPVNFKLTSDAPMNTFWIPSLGGMVYAMSGTSAKLSLMADGVGSYDGRSANISGEGYAKMTFTVRSSAPADFQTWAQRVRQSSGSLTMESYGKLAKPAVVKQPAYYLLKEPNLYDKIIKKYTTPNQPAVEGM